MKIKIDTGNSYKKAKKYFKEMYQMDLLDALLDRYGREGVEALSLATPVDTGKTASSWSYRIEKGKDASYIYWENSNVIKDYFNVALMLQYGHATGSGVYIQGRDYINPAIQPVFDQMVSELWMEVTRL